MSLIQCVIGTAGHIDHGKTSLVKALTGIDCDRLEEEKRRGITIDIGFARMAFPGGGTAGIVDVPGHQRFIRNMLAGVAGIDLAMLVVAADDAVMPQTVEHLAILEILGVGRGVVVLTKTDLVDEETLELAEMDVSDLIANSHIAGAKIIKCSSLTGEGIDQLRDELEQLCSTVVNRRSNRFFRMPVDRAFTIKGHGLVVTGTVFSGRVKPEDRLTLVPGGNVVRVRRVQSHGFAVDCAGPGARAAINITGASRGDIERGTVIADPAIAKTCKQFIADVVCHSTSPLKIVHGMSYLLHVHTAETLCRVYLASRKSLEAGSRSIAQVRFEGHVHIIHGDKFVLRSSSARHTVGGGVVVEPGGKPLGRRRLNALMEKWSALAGTEPADWVKAFIQERPLGYPVSRLMAMFNIKQSRVGQIISQLSGEVSSFEWKGEKYAYLTAAADDVMDAIESVVQNFHKKKPAMQGIEESSLAKAAAPSLSSELAGYWIRRAISSKRIESSGSALRLPGRQVEFSGEDEKLRRSILDAYRAGGLKSPPKTDKVGGMLGIKKSEAQKMIRILNQTGDLVTLAPDYTLHRDTLDGAKKTLMEEIGKTGFVETARYRDLLGVGRKAAIDILEHFDKAGFTMRKQNKRVLASEHDGEKGT